MNAISIIYVNEHLQSLRAESQRKRPMASLGEKRSLRARIHAASKYVRRSIAADEITPSLPGPLALAIPGLISLQTRSSSETRRPPFLRRGSSCV